MTQDMNCSKEVAREMASSRQALGRLMEQLRSRQGAGKEQASVCLEYAKSMARVCQEAKNIFPRWEQNIPTLGTKHSHVGNKTSLRLTLDEITAHSRRDYGSLATSLRLVVMLLMMFVGVNAWGQTTITSLSQITASDGNYIITADISGGSPDVSTFSGTLEAAINPTTHMPYKITNLSAPLFTTLTGTVKNLVLENVGISGHSGNTGAIACTANGSARIYNVGILSGSVGGTAYTGGLVGFLDGTARVVNCYSYANISGGTVKAGIVGYNNYASKYNDLRTMVMNCMFYGNIDYSSGSVYPIYGGEEISNDYTASNTNRLNNYNYFLYEAPYSIGRHIDNDKYNCALAAEERFLVRFEFYRHLLNSTRELAAWYATGNPANGRGKGNENKMAKWVLDKSIAPYPILKAQGSYPSVVNYDPVYTNDATGAKVSRKTTTLKRNQGKDLGTTLTIKIQNKTSGGQTAPDGANVETTELIRPRIDKDTLNYNFNYDKVQLPYYNEVGTGNYTGNRVVTGWKIVEFVGGTQGNRVAADFTTRTNYDDPYYNFADRDTYAKDKYSISGRVFAQGAYFNVPKGVTGITIEPYWGIAAYLSDACYDRYGYNNDDDLTQVGGGNRYENGNKYNLITGNIDTDNGQIVYTTVSDAVGALTGATGTATVYDYAVVLVGNYHHHVTTGKTGPELSDGTTPFSIMSIDLNEDNEPDYCLIYRSGKNMPISPIRFDFITVPGMVMAHKMATDGDLGIPGNCTPKGWFEITTTGLIKYAQFEHSTSGKTLAPVIFMGGVIEQFCANNTGTSAGYVNKTRYMLFGDNVWFKMFSNGCHMDKWLAPPLRPVSITGGEYEKFYLSGFFRPDAKPSNENAECYIDGGKFGEVAGAGQEQINGNVTWLIDHADIKNFYGGGINAAKPITGNITTTINNSYVDIFCGGPQFGDMQKQGSITLTWATNKDGSSTSSEPKQIDTDRLINTTATNCTFGTYFGAGYGGTSTLREQFYNVFQKLNYNEWNTKVNATYKDGTRGVFTEGKGVAYDYEYEFFGGSAGNVHRLYLLYASFSMAKANGVTSKLTDCTVQNNFYGGGSLGAVLGEIKSTLTDCTIKGNVFGAGYSVTKPKVKVRKTGGFTTEPYYNTSTGVYEEGVKPGFDEYVWDQQSIGNDGNALDLDDENHDIIKTSEDLTGLGSVSSAVTLTITTTANGKSVIGTEGDSTTGNVYGGGDASAVNNNTTPANASATVNISGNTLVRGNVFGGGNEGIVSGSTTVNIRETEPTP